MNTKSAIIGLYAETYIHPGIGQSIGAIDLPVSRERTSDYPFIPGSSVKGAFRVWAEERAGIDAKVIKDLFGPKFTGLMPASDGEQATTPAADLGSNLEAGKLLCSDARLLLLPVRCLSDDYKWVTCPSILKRLLRDGERAGETLGSVDHADISHSSGYRGTAKTADEPFALEERSFARTGVIDAGSSETLKLLARFADRAELEQRLVILSDRDFAWFARYGLPVAAHNALAEVTKVSSALWYEETLAPGTVLYLLFGEREESKIGEITGKLNGAARYIQMGGNETTGQGWFKMSVAA